MATTPQTNATLGDIARELLRRDDIVICGHVSPDGDCLGSQLALAHALRACGKRVSCVLAEEDASIDGGLAFLPGIDGLVPPSACEGPVGAFVGVDVPTVERIGDAARLHAAAAFTATIDHHAVPTTMAELVYVDPDAAATALLVWELVTGFLPALDEDVRAKVALCAYTGLATDTGRFQYQNTDAACLRAASEMVAAGADPARVAREVFQSRRLASVRLEARAIERMRFAADGQVVLSWVSRADFEELGAVKADAEPLINALRSVAGVRVACMLREQGEGIRGSLRAKDETDVSALARRYGGGGHVAAAGFTLHGDLQEQATAVLADLAALVAPEAGGGAASGEGSRR